MRVSVRKYFGSFFFILLLGLTILLSKAPLIRAVSNSVVIMQLQTAGAVTGTASEELIIIFNSSLDDIEITDWCLEYSSAANGTVFNKLGCVDSDSAQTEIWLESNGFVSFATNEFLVKNPEFVSDFVFKAGVAAIGGHLRLIDGSLNEIDRVSWGTAVTLNDFVPAIKHTEGSLLSRDPAALLIDTDDNIIDFSSRTVINPLISGVYEVEIPIDLCINIPDIQEVVPDELMADEDSECYLDACPNIDELQIEVPEDYEVLLGSSNCTPTPLEDALLFITELLANAPSSDTGKEFIELHNPNSRAINLIGYTIQVGPEFTKQYVFPSLELAPGAYLSFKDSQTSIVLPNKTGVQLRLLAPAGNMVSETSIYSEADDDVSWALVDDQWIYTNQITPAASNKPFLEQAVDEILGVTSVLAPCSVGKYRNPETNRCRNIETIISRLKPCDEDEYRNPETNRCRKAIAGLALTSCRAGQERNPETNRCRKINVLGATTDSAPTITDVAVENTAGQINWVVIFATVTATGAYMVYEWRNELMQLYGRTRAKLVQ